MNTVTALGFATAFGWAVSSFLWVMSARVKLNVAKGDTIAAGPLLEYVNKTGFWNSWAGAVSAISAALSAILIFIDSLPK
ncbi:hypothetical protein J5288_09420 [Agrobacterium sp. S2/73]|uniref:hypothetical protein n=1 Tax=unclassified Agrobacterium TaxID=2632611 RepID=UPI001ADC3CBD|nr:MULTISPECIES: hypothetical protein [unclassified Agrobacterium]MBO9108923.1 hypothetical protein [Agrobacterium sp. S2/73]QXZ73327.1 hypothetical protein J5276_05090 [Agrobacterium sp. S7/73]